MTNLKSHLRTLLEPALLAAAAGIVIRLFVHGYSIPSASMSPVLEIGDHILATSPGLSGVEPDRGDVVVFRLPGSDTRFIKRVIGLPGDLLEIRGDRVLINGHTLPEPWLQSKIDNGVYPATLLDSGQYFVMGDNRQDSIDSRTWGAVSGDSLEARARVIFWSSGDGRSIWSALAASAKPGQPATGDSFLRIGRIR